ncbi:Nucleolar complex protein 3 [Phlyctochytrium planicorne]|nr:Nucleolar complex protein 3 [Phlyctochytrium planicorne]
MSTNLTLTQSVLAAYSLLPPTNLAIEIKNLDFDYGGEPILKNVSVPIEKGTRTLLIGANGAGKSTILKLLAGKTLVKGGIRVNGKNPFFQSSEGVTYLGTEWANNPIVRRDVPVARLLKSLGAERHPERCETLLDIMDVDVNWHMHEVSDGQRRRVQIVLGLLEPWDILLLDEVTVDLDVLVRKDLLDFLREETVTRNATILYATHIFDGLGGWPTNFVHIRDGSIVRMRDVKSPDGFPELEGARITSASNCNVSDRLIDNSPLLRVVEEWLREDYKILRQKQLAKQGRLEKPKTKWEQLSENMKEDPVEIDSDNDEDILLSDEDMDLVQEYGDQFSFLMNMDPKSFDKQQQKQKKEVPLRARPAPKEVDELDMLQVRSDDEDEDDEEEEEEDVDEMGEERQEEDSDVERDYELKPRHGQGDWNPSNKPEKLPTITPEGKILRVKKEATKPEPKKAAASEGQEKKIETTNGKQSKKQQKKEAEDQQKKQQELIMSDKGLLKQMRLEAQENLATMASTLMENPEENIGMLKNLRDIGKTPDPYVFKLCLLTQLAVYKDVIPGYRIRPLTDIEKSQKVSKEVKKLRNFEDGLVSNYQAYLQQLESSLKYHLGKDKGSDGSKESKRDPSVGTTCIRCLTELLTGATHFNFRSNIMTAVVGHMATRNPPDIAVMCCNAIKRVFQNDLSGETSLEAVRLIAKFVKTRNFMVPAEVLGTFLHLRLKDELSPDAVLGKDNPKKRKRDDKEKVHISKKNRKVAKKDAEVEKELKEAEAEVDRTEKKRNQTETLKFVFITYFRVLKGAKESPQLPVVLDGLSRFAHLINIDFFADLIKVLKEIVHQQIDRYDNQMDDTAIEISLHCILAAYRILTGQGEAINIDLKDFNTSLFSQLMRVATRPYAAIANSKSNSGGSTIKHLKDQKKRSEVELALTGIELSFAKKKQIPITRAAAFAKRVMTAALSLPAHASIACIGLVRNMLMNHTRLQQLLDAEERLGAGAYLPFLDDPELCNPFSSTLWEVPILHNHYHPVVRTLAKYFSQINKESGVAGVSNYQPLPPYLNKEPGALFSTFNATKDGSFTLHPSASIPANVVSALKKKADGTARKVLGPNFYFESDFMLELKNQASDVQAGNPYLKGSKVVEHNSPALGDGDEVVDDEEDGEEVEEKQEGHSREAVLERLIRREEKLRRMVELAKEAHLDLMDEDASDEIEDEEEEEEEEGNDDDDDQMFPFPKRKGAKLNGVQRAEQFLATLKPPRR